MCVAVASSSNGLSEMLKRIAKRMGKAARNDKEEVDATLKEVTGVHMELKRMLEDNRVSMRRIGEAVQILVSNYSELVRRTRQSLRTVTVHTRQNAIFQPDMPGASLLKDSFVNT